ncbi:ABC transporter permease [Labrys sp. La1]|uniref:ABC transporter permease n=1 Tax=Labrys sp. La1 TaxID=3404917 RepID=UPI003EBCE43C
MIALIARRAVASLAILVLVTFLVFLVVYFSPGDPVAIMLGRDASGETADQIRRDLGLDRPFLVQYGAWLWGLLGGHFGTSITMHVPVLDILVPAYVNTFILALASLVIALTVGVLLGVLSGLRAGGWFDRLAAAISEGLAATPVFWLGIMLIWLVSKQLRWLPSSGMYNLRGSHSLADLLTHLVLPAFSAAVLAIAIIMRLTRASVIDALNADYARMFASAGMSTPRLLFTQIARNILAPIVSIGGLQFGTLFGGVIFVETVFAWPGLSAQLYNAITAHDIPVIQTGVLMIAATFIVINLIVDLALVWLNPRARA